MRVHSWNPSFTPLHPVGCEIERALTTGSKALAAQIAEQDAQAANDRRVRITKDVPVLRIDHISIKGMLLGVWPASYSGECYSGY